jgi:DUF4097 and DUF4098 domain-containing protein YvlB
MISLLLVGALELLGAQQQQTDTTFAVEPRSRVSIELDVGSVRVRAWDRASVRVVATHPARERIEIRRGPGSVRIEAEPGRGRRARVDYELTVPRSAHIDLDGQAAETTIEGVDGNITVDVFRGDITVRDAAGNLDLESVEGQIVVEGGHARVVAETVQRGIRISGLNGNIFAEAVNGPIVLSDIRADSVSAESINGSVQYQGELRQRGRYRLSSHNGSIGVTVPAGVGATVTVDTHTGAVETDFPVQLRGRGGSRYTFEIGGGGARLQLQSFGGTIRLVRPGGGMEQPRRNRSQ